MYTSAASENGATWMNSLLFPLNWSLLASVLVASVNQALGERAHFFPSIYPYTIESYWVFT